MNRKQLQPWVVGALLLLAAGWFVVHGLARVHYGGSSDIRTIYASTRAWLKGQDPYDYERLEQVLRDAGYDALPESAEHPHAWPSPRWQPVVYPPTTLVLLAPLGWLTYRQVVVAWAALNLVLTGSLIAVLIRVAGLNWTRHDRLYVGLLGAWLLALGPLHSSLELGQLTILVTLLIVWGAALACDRRDLGAGVLAALAVGLKPQLGVILVLYLLLRFRWRALAAAAVLLAALLAVGHGQMALHGVDWWPAWRANLYHFSHGGGGDPLYLFHAGVNPLLDSTGNPVRFQLYSLPYPLHELLGTQATRIGVQLAVLAAAGLLVALAAVRARGRGTDPERELLLLSILSLAVVLSSSHRFYDLTVLALPMAWVIRRWVRAADEGTRLPGAVRVCAVLLLLFPIASSAILVGLSDHGYIGAAITGGPLFAARGPGLWWWRGLIVPAQVWVLVLLAGGLVWGQGSGGSGDSGGSGRGRGGGRPGGIAAGWKFP
jgi:hypothetical protein